MNQVGRPALNIWGLFLAGPIIWMLHFLTVYLLAEAVCATGGVDARLAGLRLLSFLTVAATAAAATAIGWFTARCYRRWRQPAVYGAGAMDGDGSAAADRRRSEAELAFGGMLLGLFFVVAVLFVGVPAFFLQSC